MKKNFYLVALLLISTMGFSQVQSQMEDFRVAGNEMISGTNSNASRISDYNDTIWFDGFESTSNWAVTGGSATNGWMISSATGTNQGTWFFANSRITSTTGGNWAVLVPDDPNSPVLNSSQIALASAIDISAYSGQNLVLSYEKYAARFYDTLKVEVSNDNMNWTTLDYNVDFPLNSTNTSYVTPNPDSRDLFVPVSIVNGDSLFIRFNWDATRAGVEGIAYGWFIDDILLLDVVGNDLVIEETAFFDDVRILYSWYFGTMPERQAAADTLTFSATYYNRGKNDQTNAGLELIVSGQGSATVNSATTTSMAGLLGDTARTDVNYYIPNEGMGKYTFTWGIVSDSTDENPANNSYSVDMTVSGNEYSMAPLPISSANTVGKSGADFELYTLSQDYYYMTPDTIYGFGVAFDSEWSRAGAIFVVHLLDNQDVSLVQTDYIELTDEMITDDMVYFQIPETYISAGVYGAQVEVISGDSIFMVNSQDPASPLEPAGVGSYFSRTTLSYGGSNFIEDMTYLTIKNNDNITCNTNTNVTGTIDDATGIGSVTLTGVTGLGTPTYTYSWTGPNSFTSTDKDISNLVKQGDYTVTVMNIDRCVAVETFAVAGKVSVEEISFEGSVNVFPNPNNGNFNFEMTDVVAGNYVVTVKNVVGQTIYTDAVSVNGSYKGTINMNSINKGVYFLEVSTENNVRSVIRFVVK